MVYAQLYLKSQQANIEQNTANDKQIKNWIKPN